ncbi:MAG: hypothetical protein EBU90_00570 [Proteobacteria bacterium]|nr:hypothetical protein [Pseudomonadota bacterium]NBP12925.1 hypothetical protein [bacterium]
MTIYLPVEINIDNFMSTKKISQLPFNNFTVPGSAVLIANIQGTTYQTPLSTVSTGNVIINYIESATTGTITNKFPVYNSTGTLIGYVPVYDS